MISRLGRSESTELSSSALDDEHASESAADEDPGQPTDRRPDGRTSLRLVLYAVCMLTDFIFALVIFIAARTLAERHAGSWQLGAIGAGLSLISGCGNLLGGWLASHRSSRIVFVTGAAGMVGCVAACLVFDPQSIGFLTGYWCMGICGGFIYPPLVGWLNRGEDAHAHHVSVSRRLIFFCIAWNFGMICGQLSGGALFDRGPHWTIGAALWASVVNVLLALLAVRIDARLPVVAGSAPSREHHAHIATAAKFKRLSRISNLGGVFGGSIVIYLLADVMVHLNIDADAHGVLISGWRGVIIATYLVMHFLGFWHYRLSVSIASQLLGALGLLVIARAETQMMLMIGLSLLGQLVGFNYFSGLYYSTAGSSHETRAFAAGIHEATLAAGMALGTVAGGVLGSWIDHRMPYYVAAYVILLLIAVQAAFFWTQDRASSRADKTTVAGRRG